ncbi:MAG: hypothetical protein J6Y80_01275 [Victivallales bacterium]|nr:hypothetical protein [Victivallales bacterium]
MRVSQEIRIIDLLARREAEFLTVKDCEDQIRELLGGCEFPFPPAPVELPSNGRTNAKKAWRPQGFVVPKSAPPKKTAGRREALQPAALPPPVTGDATSCQALPLNAPAENAYLVHYHEKDKEGTSFLTEPSQVQSLLELACDSFRVTKVEAVAFRSLEDFDVLRTIWTETAPDDPQTQTPC